MPSKLTTLAAVTLIAALGGMTATLAQQKDEGPPLWAYGYNAPAPPGATVARLVPVQRDTVKKFTLPDSKYSFSDAQIQGYFEATDWFPEDHGTMPDVVAHGRQSAQPPVRRCSFCHMANGMGRPENSSLAGLPYEYIVQQMHDYRKALRKPSDPRKTNLMVEFAQGMSDQEIHDAATYFSTQEYKSAPDKPWVKVIEAATVPKMEASGGIFFPLEGAKAGTEPLGSRILETPVNAQETEIQRNPRSGFIAYVPPGSIKKGEALAMTGGGGRFTACTVCHGPTLQGLGPVPSLAGRSPSYLGRQLYDMQHGNRTGAWSPLMASVVSELTPEDIVNLAAYTASLTP